jgi:hypothetical protein
VRDLGLGGRPQVLEALLLGLQIGLVGGDLALVLVELSLGLGVVVHRRRRRLGGDAGEHVGLQPVVGIAGVGQQRDGRRPARHEPVDGDLLDLGAQRVDVALQLDGLGGELVGTLGEVVELELSLEEVRGRLVGAVLGGGDLGRCPFGGAVVGVGTGGRTEPDRRAQREEHGGRRPVARSRPARHGPGV